MKLLHIASAIVLGLAATAASAELRPVADRTQFVEIVAGKTLTRPLVRIAVSPDGSLEGKGASWDITGNWSWQNGFFCRDINWGGDDLAYNCQEVRTDGSRIRFTSDKGGGRSADFRLR